ncbi:MAG: hypothetical protein JNK05_21855 [Myxococcales bacterium]|nr:hypothetical protein [Myxococcales bacterium]
MRRSSACALALVAAIVASCGVPSPLGLEEPIRVERAMLVSDLATRDSSTTAITAFENPSALVAHQQRGKLVSGRATRDAFAVAMRLQNRGTGYWVLPLSTPDPSANDELTFEAMLSFAGDVTPGPAVAEVRAVGRDGVAGPASFFPLCLLGPIPDNLNVCDPSLAPPLLVVSLGWDTDADLDLEVELPDGRRIGPKRPSAGVAGAIDIDAGASCRHDGARRENFVVADAPLLGRYRVYASLFDACGQSHVYTRATVHRRALGAREGTFSQAETARADAQLTAFNVGAGERGAQLVLEFSLP